MAPQCTRVPPATGAAAVTSTRGQSYIHRHIHTVHGVTTELLRSQSCSWRCTRPRPGVCARARGGQGARAAHRIARPETTFPFLRPYNESFGRSAVKKTLVRFLKKICNLLFEQPINELVGNITEATGTRCIHNVLFEAIWCYIVPYCLKVVLQLF